MTEFETLVARMRDAQNKYFAAKKRGASKGTTDELLRRSLALEAQVDRHINEKSQQPTAGANQAHFNFLAK